MRHTAPPRKHIGMRWQRGLGGSVQCTISFSLSNGNFSMVFYFPIENMKRRFLRSAQCTTTSGLQASYSHNFSLFLFLPRFQYLCLVAFMCGHLCLLLLIICPALIPIALHCRWLTFEVRGFEVKVDVGWWFSHDVVNWPAFHSIIARFRPRGCCVSHP